MDSFYALADVLAKPPKTIDILPKDAHLVMPECPSISHGFLFVDGNLGVPKNILYKLFMAAVGAFNSSQNWAEMNELREAKERSLIASSAVILLANPAHVTALNARKHSLLRGALKEDRELSFTTSLLSCRDMAKESILWDYRRWLLQRIHASSDLTSPQLSSGYTVTQKNSSSNLLPLSAVRTEVDIALQACEVYPRNYHAWTHWQTCLRSLEIPIPSSSTFAKVRRTRLEYLGSEVIRLQNWIEKHISDHSAVHHLCSLLLFLRPQLLPQDDESTRRVLDAASVFAHAKSLVLSYPQHESLWMYLRVAVATEEDDPLRSDLILQIVDAFQENKTHFSYPQRFLRQSLSWWEIALKGENLRQREVTLPKD